MLVSEIFYSLQGEGPLAGRPSAFVRTAGCDYRCTWCDTRYAVWPEHRAQWRSLTPEAIWRRVVRLAPHGELLTLTGGNPALQKDAEALVALAQHHGWAVALETQGSAARPWLRRLDHLIVSPKPPSAGNVTPRTAIEHVLGCAAGEPSIAFKVVIADAADYAYAREITGCWSHPVYLQPCHQPGSEPLAEYRALVDRVLADDWARVTVLPQLHVLLWDGERGR